MMRSIYKKLTITKGITKFLFTPTFTIQKISQLPKYTQVYCNMYDKRQEKIEADLQQFLKEERQRKQKESIQNQILSWKSNIGEKIEEIKNKKKEEVDNLKSGSFQQTFKHYGNKGFQYLGLYYESLQALIEGRREVLHNEHFKFDDGLSVKEKQEKMEAFLNKMMGKPSTKSEP